MPTSRHHTKRCHTLNRSQSSFDEPAPASDDIKDTELHPSLEKMLEKPADPMSAPMSAEIADFERVVNAGEFQSRDKVALKFYRAGAGGKSEAYKTLTSNEDRKAFRQQWAACRLKELQVEKYKSTGLKLQEIEEGEWKNWSNLIAAEGGDAAAKAAAYHYARKCIEMGPNFYSFNEWTRRWEFLHFTRKNKSIFEKAWVPHNLQR
eukprot:15446064-Alexandrium_andersonii.AAC.1